MIVDLSCHIFRSEASGGLGDSFKEAFMLAVVDCFSSIDVPTCLKAVGIWLELGDHCNEEHFESCLNTIQRCLNTETSVTVHAECVRLLTVACRMPMESACRLRRMLTKHILASSNPKHFQINHLTAQEQQNLGKERFEGREVRDLS